MTDWWRVYGSAREWDYSRTLAILPRLDAFNLLSSSTLTLANSFLENDRRLGFEWRAGRNLINLSFGRERTAGVMVHGERSRWHCRSPNSWWVRRTET